MKKLFLSFVLSVSITLCCEAQEFSFKQKPLMFFDNNSNQVILIDNDSIVIKTKHNINFPLKTNGIPAPLSEFIPFTIKSKNYFVHSGCGVVLEYRNDSIVRIDESFVHDNQYSAANFVYNDEIYFFGGYGLFTTKNIITRYDSNLNEWNLVSIRQETSAPYLTSAYSIKVNNSLYVFGGIKSINTQLIENDKYVYSLDLKNWSWKKKRTNFFNANKNISVNVSNSFIFKNKIIINNLNEFVSIDLVENKIIRYKNFFPYTIEQYPLVLGDKLFAILDN